MLNQTILIGRTTRDIELKESTNGRPFCIATLAIGRPFKEVATGEYETDFIDVILWGSTAVNTVEKVGKGSSISVRGRVANRVIEMPDGQTIKTIGIIGNYVSFIQLKAPDTMGINGETTEVCDE